MELFDTPEIPLLLGECKRVLRPGGCIVVVGMSKEGPQSLVVQAFEWAHRYFPTVLDCRPVFVSRALEAAAFRASEKTMMRRWAPVEIVLARN